MDLSALLHPRLPDRASLDEFVDALADRAPEVEHLVADLRRAPADRTLIGSLFRSLHTIKGDAAMCRVDLGVMIAHPIETLLARLRSEELAFSDLFAELLLLALDRLELAVESLADGRRLDALKLPELVGGLELLGGVPRDALDGQIARVIESVTGFRPSAASRLDLPPLAVPNDLAGDLAFFRELALKLEARSPLAVFARGFAVARGTDGATLARRTAFTPGMPFDLLLQDGRVRATTGTVHADGPHLRTDA